MTLVTATRYELLRIGDLVQYIDPVPEDLKILKVPGIVVEVRGIDYLRVKWLDDASPAGFHLRGELKLLSRADQPEKTQKKKL
jgi:hypothetical protein